MTGSSSKGLVLHHLEASRSIRVLWLLEYLQAPYELKLYNRDQKTKLAETEPFSGQGLAAIHPIGRSPLLQDDALTLAESGTIFRHLLEHHHGKASCPKPSEKSQAAVDLNFWIDFSEASIMLHLLPLFYLVKGQANTKDGSALQEKVAARGLVNDFKFIETSLEKNNGSLTGGDQLGPADFANLFGVEFFSLLLGTQTPEWRESLNLRVGPATEKWIKKCHADEAYRKACSLERDSVTPEKYLYTLLGKQ